MDKQTQLSRPSLNLESRPGGGCIANFQIGTCPISGPVILAAIDGKSIEGLNRDEINSLLTGPPGSTVELSVLTVHARLKDITVSRSIPADRPNLERPTINFEQVDIRNLQPANDGRESDGLDIEARAAINLALRGVNQWPLENKKTSLSGFLKLASVDYEVGALSSGDAAFNEAERRIKRPLEAAVLVGAEAPDLLETLCAVGREADAERLIGAWPSSGTWSFFRSDHFYKDPIWSALREGKKEKAERYLRNYLRVSRMSGDLGSHWLHLYYKQVGRYRDALALYPARLDHAEHGYLGWMSVQESCAVLNERAFLEYKLGEEAKAKDTLNQAVAQFYSALDAEQIACVEKTPGLYPKLSDLKDTLASLENGKGFTRDPLPTEQLLNHNRPDIRASFEAVVAGKKAKSLRLLNGLLSRYPQSSDELSDYHGQVSLYCSILNLARRMSDRGWTTESTNVLDSLLAKTHGANANPAAKIYLVSELIYNKRFKSQSEQDEQWLKLSAINPGPVSGPGWGGTSSVGSFSNLLRGLALNFYYAEEFDRAAFFMNRALAEFERESIATTESNSSIGSFANRKALFLLSEAIVSEGKGNTAKSIKLIHEAISLSNTPSTYCNYALIELAYEFGRHGRSRSAIDFLKRMRKEDRTLDTSPEAASQLERDTALVRLLYLSGEINEAYSLANSLALTVVPERAPPLLSWLRASCAERLGHFGLAARLYKNVDNSSSYYYLRVVDSEMTLRKAIALAERSSDFDKAELAKMYLEAARELSIRNSPELVYKLRSKAISLLPDNSVEKFRWKNNLFSMKCFSHLTGIKEDIPEDRPEWAKRKWPGLSKFERWQLNTQIDLAQEADEKRFSDGRELWEQVVAFELAHGFIDAGLEQARKNLSRYSKADAVLFKRPVGSLLIAERLAAVGRERDAEKFLDDVVAKVRSVAGEHSVQAQAQLVDLFAYYLSRKEYEKAETVLNQILSYDLTTGPTPIQYDSVSHCGPGTEQPGDAVAITAALIELLPPSDKDVGRRIHFLKMILAAHERALKADDERLVVILKTIAETYFATKNYQEAQKYYDRAYAINRNYYKRSAAVWKSGNHFCDNLRALGRKEEAAELEELQ